MSAGLDIDLLKRRALLMRHSDKVVDEPDCRNACVTTVECDDRTITLLELGYYCRTKRWPVAPEDLGSTCGTPGCVIHVDLVDDDAMHLQLVADRPVVRTLAEIFASGRSRGWFKGGGGYAR